MGFINKLHWGYWDWAFKRKNNSKFTKQMTPAQSLIFAIDCMDHGEPKRAQYGLLEAFNHAEVVEITAGLLRLMDRIR